MKKPMNINTLHPISQPWKVPIALLNFQWLKHANYH